MDIFKLSVLVLVFCAHVCIAGSSVTEDRDIWTDIKNLEVMPSKTHLLVYFAGLVKRAKEQKVHGLMGRSIGITQPVRLGGRRNNGENFVGLMGKRSPSKDFQEEWDRPQLY